MEDSRLSTVDSVKSGHCGEQEGLIQNVSVFPFRGQDNNPDSQGNSLFCRNRSSKPRSQSVITCASLSVTCFRQTCELQMQKSSLFPPGLGFFHLVKCSFSAKAALGSSKGVRNTKQVPLYLGCG